MKAFQITPFVIRTNSIPFFLNRKFAGYIFLFISITIASSSFSLMGYSSASLFRAIFLIQLINFMAFGILHTVLLEKHPYFSLYSLKEKYYFSSVLTLIIYGMLLLFYFIVNANMQKIVLASCCAFLLPYMFYQSWFYFLRIPENKSMVWYGYKATDENADIIYLSTILVHLKLSRKYMVFKEDSFLINSPLHLELGKLFNSFLSVEKNSDSTDIECTDKNNIPYGWKFFAVSFGGLYNRELDPSKSLHDNKNIQKNTTILAKRMSMN
ncbi:MAG: TssN family type VI secretion system protein [Chitinophagaceae bacterium]